MKFSITQKNLLKCLNIIQPSVMTKAGSLPVLNNFLVNATKDGILFVATDLEIAIKHTLKNDFSLVNEGNITIPFKKFYDIVSSIDSENEITVYIDDDKLYVTSGKMKVKIATLPATDYPAIPSINEKESFKINAMSVVDMIEKTIFSVSDDKNSVLNGLLWKKVKNNFTIAATDGRRLGVVWREIKDGVKKDFEIIMPSRILSEVSSFINSNCSEKDDVIIDISSNQVGFRIGDTDFVSRFIEGKFPSYESIIPKTFESIAKVESDKLLNSTKRATICSGDVKSGFVKYTFKKDVLIISTSSQSLDYEDEIDCEFSSISSKDGFSVSYPPRFILDILKNLDSKEVELKFTGSQTPTMVKIDTDENLFYLIMPLKI